MCRPSALVIGLISIILLIFLKQKPFEPLKFLRESLLSVLCFFIVIIPWTLYNRYSIGEWILINDASGYALWASNHPESIKLWEHKFTTSIEFTEYSNFITATLASNKIEEWKDTQNYTSLSLSQRERLWQKESFKNAYENPYITLRLIMWKTWGFWRPYLNIQAYPYRAVIYSGILLSLLYLFSLLGFFRLWQENAVRQFMVLFIVYIVVTTLLHSVVYSMMRYRIPFIDPYMCMFAGLGLYHLYVKCYALACSNRINLRVL